LVTYYVLFFLHVETRRVTIAGITDQPEESWMQQMTRNASSEEEGWLSRRKIRYLLHDRDTKFCASFRDTLAAGGVKCLRLPARSPNLNAYCERWVRTVKEECLSKLILFGGRFVTAGAAGNSKRTITGNATTKARATFCYFQIGRWRRRSEGHRSAVTSASAVFSSTTTERPHEFFGYTGSAR
jgi:hypothetical protein